MNIFLKLLTTIFFITTLCFSQLYDPNINWISDNVYPENNQGDWRSIQYVMYLHSGEDGLPIAQTITSPFYTYANGLSNNFSVIS